MKLKKLQTIRAEVVIGGYTETCYLYEISIVEALNLLSNCDNVKEIKEISVLETYGLS